MANTYKFGGSNVPGQEVNRLVLEGTSVEPTKSVVIGGTVELTEEEVKEYRAAGLKFTKTNADGTEDDESTEQDPQTRAEQQAAQVATGAGPAADPDKDNTPGGRAATGKK